MTLPTHINGSPIIASKPRAFGVHRIFVFRGGHPHPYVVASYREDDDTWYWGNYFTDFKTATEFFNKEG